MKKLPKSNDLTEANLRILFNGFNSAFFNGRLNPCIKVRLVSTARLRHVNKHHEADAMWRPQLDEIWLDKRYARSESYMCILLLHEMAHAALEATYIGHPCINPGHGMIFQAELYRLFHAGAYDGML